MNRARKRGTNFDLHTPGGKRQREKERAKEMGDGRWERRNDRGGVDYRNGGAEGHLTVEQVQKREPVDTANNRRKIELNNR